MNKCIAVIPNAKASGVADALPLVCRTLRNLSVNVLLPDDTFQFQGTDMDALIQSANMVIALGGDGTIIHTAKRAAYYDKAVLGINCGTLGFMAGLEADELTRLTSLLSGDYLVNERMMLEVAVTRNSQQVSSLLALNEAVISRGSFSRMISMNVDNHGERVIRYDADGVIVATPTGSTAYSLSAGGPIMDPSLQGLLLTPICPHSLHSRPYIFNDSAILTVQSSATVNTSAFLSVDGEEGTLLLPEDKVIIRKSERTAKLITIKAQPFYEVLHQKLMDRD